MDRLTTTILAGIAAVLMTYFPARAEAPPLPDPLVEEVMVKTSLLTLNDANITGNYDVMQAKMAKAFRDRFGADTLKQAFRSFAGKHIDIIAAKPIVATSAAKIDAGGALMLRGYFDTTPSRLTYELDYAISEGEWKLINIDIKVKGPSTSDAGGAGLLTKAAAEFPAATK